MDIFKDHLYRHFKGGTEEGNPRFTRIGYAYPEPSHPFHL